MGLYDSFYDEDSECPKCRTKIKRGWQTKRLESLLESWRKGDFLQYRKFESIPEKKRRKKSGDTLFAPLVRRTKKHVSKTPLLLNGKVPVHITCDNCKTPLEAYAKVTHGRFVGIVEAEADIEPKELILINPETTAKTLREEFERRHSHLQESCNHKRTQAMEFEWAPGHFAGQVRACLRCEKILERKKGWETAQALKRPKKSRDKLRVQRNPCKSPQMNKHPAKKKQAAKIETTRTTSHEVAQEKSGINPNDPISRLKPVVFRHRKGRVHSRASEEVDKIVYGEELSGGS